MPYVLLTLTPLFWAGNFVMARGLSEQIAPISLSYLRWSLALLILLPWALLRLWRARQQLRQSIWIIIALAILGVANFNTFVYSGLQNTSAQNALLLLAPLPLYVALFEWLLERKSMSKLQSLGLSMAMGGMLIIISRGQWHSLLKLDFSRGDLWIVAALLSWSIYSVLLKYRPKDIDGFTLFASMVLIAVIALTPFFWFERHSLGQPLQLPTHLLLAIVYMAVCASILAYLFWNAAVARVGALRASFFIYLQPLFGIGFAYIFLAEQLSSAHLLGAGIIASGIVLANWRRPGDTSGAPKQA